MKSLFFERKKKPKLSEKTKAYLQNMYQADIQKLEVLIKRDLSVWGKKIMSKLLKVAVIEPVGGHGGMDYYDFGLCEGLSVVGVDVVLHTSEQTEIYDTQPFEVRHTYCGTFGDAPSWKRGIRYALGSLKAVVSSVFEGRKLVHFHFFHVGVLETFNVALAKIFFRKVVITAHDVESFVESLSVPKLACWVYHIADGVVAHNQISKHELIDKLGVEEKNIAVIPHGNYLHMLRGMPSKSEARQALNIVDDAKVLLFFGQIKDVKGLDILLNAMPMLLEQHPNTILLIAGRPWKADFLKYESIIKKLGIQAVCVLHIRFIQDEEVPVFYAAADLVVLPYRRIYQSGVLLMSMSYGRATVSSDLDGMREVVADGKTGLLFESENTESLSIKLIEALGNINGLKIVESNALAMMDEEYDWKKIGEQTKAVYESVC